MGKANGTRIGRGAVVATRTARGTLPTDARVRRAQSAESPAQVRSVRRRAARVAPAAVAAFAWRDHSRYCIGLCRARPVESTRTCPPASTRRSIYRRLPATARRWGSVFSASCAIKMGTSWRSSCVVGHNTHVQRANPHVTGKTRVHCSTRSVLQRNRTFHSLPSDQGGARRTRRAD
jgi:hypothetical protein